jgi:hypothetical protein
MRAALPLSAGSLTDGPGDEVGGALNVADLDPSVLDLTYRHPEAPQIGQDVGATNQHQHNMVSDLEE